jgi:hypothetical protein
MKDIKNIDRDLAYFLYVFKKVKVIFNQQQKDFNYVNAEAEAILQLHRLNLNV